MIDTDCFKTYHENPESRKQIDKCQLLETLFTRFNSKYTNDSLIIWQACNIATITLLENFEHVYTSY